MAKKPSIPARVFTATPYDTAEEKSAAYVKLARFIDEGCPEAKFTMRLYNVLQRLFGHIAYFSRDGFYQSCFATPQKRLRFVRRAFEWHTLGSPSHCWCDVERALVYWMRTAGIPQRYLEEANAADREETLATVHALLGRLSPADRAAVLAVWQGAENKPGR